MERTLGPRQGAASDEPPTLSYTGSMHPLRTGALAALTAGALSTALVVGVHRRITRPPRRPLVGSPADHDLPHEDVEFHSRGDGKRLSGWYIPAVRDDPAGYRHAVIAMQGWNRHRGDEEMRAVELYQGFVRRGLDVLAFDNRGRGLSEDHANQFGDSEYLDALGAFDWLRARFLAECGDEAAFSIGIYGISMGGAVAILAAAVEPRISAVVADSPYADVRELVRAEVGRRRLPHVFAEAAFLLARANGRPVGVLRPIDAVAKIPPRPLLLIHGGQDNLTPVADSYRLRDQTGGAADLWLVPQAGHVGAYYWFGDAYIDRVVAALKAVVPTASPPRRSRRNRPRNPSP